MSEGQILWLIIDIIVGLGVLAAIIVSAAILISGRTGSTSKKPSKKETKNKE